MSNARFKLLASIMIVTFIFTMVPATAFAQPTRPETWVDSTFDETTPGWDFTHFNTVQAAHDAVDDGGTIYIAPGTYYENLLIFKSVSIVGSEKEQVVIDGGAMGPVISAHGPYLSLEHVTLTNGTVGVLLGRAEMVFTRGLVITPPAAELVIDNCTISDNLSAGINVTVEDLAVVTVENSTIANNGMTDAAILPSLDPGCETGGGIRVNATSTDAFIDATISNNVIEGNDGGGIRLGWISGDTSTQGDLVAVIEGNEINNNKGGAIRAQTSDVVDVTVVDNDFRNIEETRSGGIIRIGLASCSDGDPAEDVTAMITNNRIDCGDYDDSVRIGGVIRVHGNTINATVEDNDIRAGYYVGGIVRIGSNYYTQAVDVTTEIVSNTIDIAARDLGGVFRIHGSDSINATVSDNVIAGYVTDRSEGQDLLKGGAIRIGKHCRHDPTTTVEAVVSGNVIAPSRGGGIRIVGTDSVTATVMDNVVSGNRGGGIRIGWWCHYWNILTESVDATVVGNTVIGNQSAGIHIDGSDSVVGSITGNKIVDTRGCTNSNADYDNPGIFIGGQTASTVDIYAHFNTISGNNTGLVSELPVRLEAWLNWWGDDSGPYHETLNTDGTGNEVIGDVNFSPWLITPQIEISEPGQDFETSSNRITVTGTYVVNTYGQDQELVPDITLSSRGGSITATAADGVFSASVPLATGTQEVVATASFTEGAMELSASDSVTGNRRQTSYINLDPEDEDEDEDEDEYDAEVLPSESAVVGPGQQGMVELPGLITLTVPPGAYTETLIYTVALVSEDEDTSGPGLFRIGGLLFRITAETLDGDPVTDFLLPLIVTAAYDEDDTPSSDVDKLAVYRYDPDLGWLPLPSTARSDTVSASFDHLSLFGVFYSDDLPVLTDITGHWAQGAILELAWLGIVSGYPGDVFMPSRYVSRQELARMIVALLDEQPSDRDLLAFADSDAIPDWSAGYLATAVELGIISGFDDDTFRPTANATRAQVAVMLMKALGAEVDVDPMLDFVDSKDVPLWALPYVAKAVELGLITGFDDNTFRPDAEATRAQVAAMLARLLRLL